jgi:hypothetical protein
MNRKLQQRALLLIAVFMIGVALVCLLVPHTHSANGADWLAIVPLLFAGLISPLLLLPELAFGYRGRIPAKVALAPAFQRPPPSRRRA